VIEHAPLVLITSWCLCIRMAIRIVEAPDALGALQDEDIQSCALRLACYLRAHPSKHATTISIVLAGLGLPQGIAAERKAMQH
jgi:hypothetical protein